MKKKPIDLTVGVVASILIAVLIYFSAGIRGYVFILFLWGIGHLILYCWETGRPVPRVLAVILVPGILLIPKKLKRSIKSIEEKTPM